MFVKVYYYININKIRKKYKKINNISNYVKI